MTTHNRTTKETGSSWLVVGLSGTLPPPRWGVANLPPLPPEGHPLPREVWRRWRWRRGKLVPPVPLTVGEPVPPLGELCCRDLPYSIYVHLNNEYQLVGICLA